MVRLSKLRCCFPSFLSVKQVYSDLLSTLVSKSLADLQQTAVCLVHLILHQEPTRAVMLERKNQGEKSALKCTAGWECGLCHCREHRRCKGKKGDQRGERDFLAHLRRITES